MESYYQEEIKQPEEPKRPAPPPPPGFVPESQLTPPPPGDFIPEETLIQKADRAATEALLGPVEAVANIGAGAAGWIGGQAVGYGKLLYDAWRSGGRDVSWQDFEADFHNASKAISSVGGLYKQKTQVGKDLARMAGLPFEKADKYWGGLVDRYIENPETNAALKTIGGTAIGVLLGKVVHSAGKGAVRSIKESVVPPKASRIAFPQKGQQFIQRPEIVKEMTDAIRKLKPLQTQQKAQWSKQYAQKFGRSEKAYQKVGGEAGAEAATKAMGGKMERTPFNYEPIRQAFSQEKIDYLFDEVMRSPLLRQGERLTAKEGLKAIFSQEGTNLPQAKSLYYLSRVFGKDLVSSIRKNWDTWDKAKHHLTEVVNIPRSLKASYDASAPFRQGLYLVGRKEFWGSVKEMFKLMEGKGNYEALMKEIAQHENYQWAKDSGLEITEMPSKSGTHFYEPRKSKTGKVLEQILEEKPKDMPMREEQFYSEIAEKIPGVGWSGRVYTGFLNKLRFDTFNSLVKDAERLGKKPQNNPKMVQDIATFINSATGRGKLKARDIHSFLNTFFFSPRLIKARIDMLNPVYYAKLHPYARKQALKSLFTVLGAGSTVLGLVKAFNLGELEGDPSSADFAKIKVGNTRVDIWGGNQQFIVPLWRIKGISRYDVALRSLEYKESPPFAFLTALMKGKDEKGKPVKVKDEALEMIYPLFLKDVADIAKDDPDLIPLSFLGAIGFGLQTYEKRKKLVR
jgi:hypothetical protein